ncbi:MAG: tRNA (guanine(46)-N(7))-methyltransferase TrmB [Paracoccaceae bacterium]
MTKEENISEQPPRRNFYGRQHGKTLRSRHKEFLAQDLTGLSPGLISPKENPSRLPLDMTARFMGKPVWLEIGFGGGEHLVHQAARNSEVAIIGCEPFINGVAMLLGKIREAKIDNIAVYPGDVRDLFDVLPAKSIQRAFLLYPDPWPKHRHVSRRFMNAIYLDPLAKVLAPGAVFRVATDIPDYAKRAREQLPSFGFDLQMESPDAWTDWARTRYERKAIREGRVPHYMTFTRR